MVLEYTQELSTDTAWKKNVLYYLCVCLRDAFLKFFIILSLGFLLACGLIILHW